MANDGVLSLVNSNVINNYSARGGGGLHNNFFGTLRLTNSTISGNLAGVNGGGFNNTGALTLTNSTVSGNPATQDGGGFRTSGVATVTTSTISGNTASQDGGGVYHAAGTLFLNETLISGNTASALGTELYRQPSGPTINANNSNLFGYGGDPRVTNFIPGVTDIVPGDVLAAILDTALRNKGRSAGWQAMRRKPLHGSARRALSPVGVLERFAPAHGWVFSAMRLSPHHPRHEILTPRPAKGIMTATILLS